MGTKGGGRQGVGDEDDDEGEDPREVARKKRIERKESVAADRLEYLVALIRRELGKPQALLNLDDKTREIRFESLSRRLGNFSFVEVMLGLVKYYFEHWNENETEARRGYLKTGERGKGERGRESCNVALRTIFPSPFTRTAVRAPAHCIFAAFERLSIVNSSQKNYGCAFSSSIRRRRITRACVFASCRIQPS